LFNNPYYQCTANYYVASNGSDNNNGSSGAPWATLQHADDMNVGAGACVNVAPGTYGGVSVANGGNKASATGYVVYRCQALDACTINGSGGDPNGFDFGNTANYVQIDGFTLTGPDSGNSVIGVNVWNGGSFTGHHIWVLNSIISNWTQSGLQLNSGDYFYAIHNTLFHNSHQDCVQGSGISFYQDQPVAGYNPTADDMTNPNPLLGPTWVNGSSFFHSVVEYNVTYNNAVTQCNPNTDGNGIIMDTFLGISGNVQNYTSPVLIAFNVSYNNGGSGIHLLGTTNIVVANNSCYNNYLDTRIQGTYRACMDDVGGYANTFINNIAQAIPTTGPCNVAAPYTQWNNAVLEYSPQTPYDTWSHNITDTIGVSCSGEVAMVNGESYTQPPNLLSTSPLWVDVGTSSVGTESTPPVGTNFALAPGSKAIGAGLTEPYLPASSVDIGACASALTTCP